MTTYRTLDADGVEIFYREAGAADAADANLAPVSHADRSGRPAPGWP